MRALAWLGLATAVSAAPPALESFSPAGGQIGTKVEMMVAGKGLDKDAPVAWSSHPGLVLLAGDKPKKFIATIAKEVPPGAYLVRFYNDDGSSPPRIFEVGKWPEFAEKEPNDAFADAKGAEARMNVVFNGVLEKSGDVDTHAIRVQKGRAITLEVHGYALGSPMDPAMRLLNARGIEVAGGHDTHNLDPRIEHTPGTDGVMFVQVFAFAHPPAADVALKGGASHVYRLIVTDEARAAAVAGEPAKIVPPATISGTLSKQREEDGFTLTAKKGEDFAIQARSRRFDVVLRVEDAEGKSLATADDGEKDSSDAALRWKAPKDGDFKIVVADRFHGGSSTHAYELEVKAATPVLAATLDTHAYRVEAGKSVEVKLNVKPTGSFTGKLTAKALELPAGVTAEPVEVPAKGGDVKLVLKATAEAAASQAPFRIEVSDGAQTFVASYTVPFTEPRGDLLITTDTKPWLTVAAKKAETKAPAK
ncbi:MAG: hypothetical protein JNG86_02800 [Verrucomicrobiaceae bacterium]|nr:hypothetical protein [Verrucomicrobiaceae bacterium]